MPGASEPLLGAVLLCAGGSRRLGAPKQLLRRDGETLVRRAARLALATRPADAVAVLGAGAEAVAGELEGLPIRIVVCAGWEAGMGRSLASGLASLHASCAGALVLLTDQPALSEAHLAALVAAWRLGPASAAATGYAGVVGVPAVLPRAWFGDAAPDGDRGARDLLRARRAEVRVVTDESLARDVDQPADTAGLLPEVDPGGR